MEISRLCAPSLHSNFDHALTFIQTNVLVASDGHARIAGLGTAFIPSTVPVVPDIDRSFHGTASELIDAQRWGVTQDIKATTANDVYAFAVLAWEVRITSVASLNKLLIGTWFLVRFSLGNLRSPRRTFSQGITQC